jgi:hypothetical protein
MFLEVEHWLPRCPAARKPHKKSDEKEGVEKDWPNPFIVPAPTT